jgi:hypothetical protein
MPPERRIWLKPIVTSFGVPQLPCPSCGETRLCFKEDSFRSTESKASLDKRRYIEDWHPIYTEFLFSGILECKRCNEQICCCGRGYYEPVSYPDEDGDYQQELSEYFVPDYFYPPMLIFKPSQKVPLSIRKEIMRSFQVFFCDPNAAANHIRNVLEIILSDQRIANLTKNGKWRSLDQRIIELARASQENADRASALRWIGNFASHPEGVKRENVLDAYEILEFLLEDIYIAHRSIVAEKVRSIVDKKRPLSSAPS